MIAMAEKESWWMGLRVGPCTPVYKDTEGFKAIKGRAEVLNEGS